MVNKLWGKTPNVLEQRLLVALYQAGRAMTQPEILELATSLGLMNVSSNLIALHEKGLVAKGTKGQMSLTPGGAALTKVGLEHHLFATPKEFADLVNKPDPQPEPPIPSSSPAPPRAIVDKSEEQAAQRLWERTTSRAESSRLAQSPRLSSLLQHLQHRDDEPPSSTSSVAPSDFPTPVRQLRAVATPPSSAVLPNPLVEPTKPSQRTPTEIRTPKPTVANTRRLPPPPPPRFRK